MNAKHDENHVPTMIAISDADGVTLIPIKINPVTGGIKVSDGMAGSVYGRVSSQHDDNHVPTMSGVSSADMTTVVPIFADSNGYLLIKST